MKNSSSKAALITSLLLLLLFPNLLVLIGYTVNESIFLGLVAGLSGGLIAGWGSREEDNNLLENTDSQFNKIPEEKSLKKLENRDDAQNTQNSNKELNSSQNLGDLPKKESEKLPDISPTYIDAPKKNVNKNYSSQKNINYELKFLDKSTEEKTTVPTKISKRNNVKKKSTSKKEISIRAQRKGVSLFSWFLMKEGESFKKRRR